MTSEGNVADTGILQEIYQLRILDNADELLATIILNILTDLKEREPAPNLAEDAPDLEKVLSAIDLRFPLMRHQAESILQ